MLVVFCFMCSTVMSLEIVVDSNVGCTLMGTPHNGLCQFGSQSTGSCNLYGAVQLASSVMDDVEILLEAEATEYKVCFPGLNFASTNHINITASAPKNLTVDTTGPPTTLITAKDLYLRLKNVNFVGGSSPNGGAILVISGSVTITGGLFFNNALSPTSFTVYGGAAIQNRGAMRINGCQFVGNFVSTATSDAKKSSGGAIFNYGNMVISKSHFLGNEAASEGGAIYSIGPIVLFANSFEENKSGGSGGAIYNEVLNNCQSVDNYFADNVGCQGKFPGCNSSAIIGCRMD